MGRISACVITRNEERVLERCLRSLAFADEIVVVDAESADRTLDVARKFAHRVVTNPWRGFSEQRNVALQHASGDWVFFLDSDEEASAELGRRLKEVAAGDLGRQPQCYSVRRIEYFLGKQLCFGPGNPSHQWRFFQRRGVRFEGEIHEFPRFDGPVGVIEEAIFHWPNLDVSRFLTKMNHYTTLEALDRFAQGQRTTLAHAVLTFFSTFMKNGAVYRGFLNGREGFVLTLLESVSRVVRHLKLWVFWQVHEGRMKIDLGVRLPAPGSARALTKSEVQRPVWKEQP